MNPIKLLLAPFKFIWNDVKTDWIAIKDLSQIIQGKKQMEQEKKEKFKKAFTEGWGDWGRNFLKTGWIFFLILCLAFASGWFYSAKHYQSVCNEYIYDTYIEPQIHSSMYGMNSSGLIDWEDIGELEVGKG